MQLTRSWRLVLMLGIAASLPFITWVVYLDADTASGMMNFYYVPILVAAIFLGDVAGMVTAISAGIVSATPPVVLHVPPVETLVSVFVRLCFFYALAILAARLSAQFQMRAQELSSLLSVGRAINASRGLQEVFQTIVDKALDLAGAKAAAISLLTPDGRHLVLEASRGLADAHQGKPLVTPGDEQVREAMARRRPLLFPRDARAPGSQGWPEYAEREGIQSLACVPVIMRDRPFGVLCIYHAARTRFSRRGIRLLEAFADQAAIAIENARLYEDVRNNYWDTVRALARAIEAKDPYTLGHSERVTQYALRMGSRLHLSAADMETLRFGCILHDIGRIGVAEQAPNSAAAMSPQDEMLARLHPLIGKSILQPVAFLKPALDIVLYHHEHLDGSGYPEGLSGDGISRLARLVVVANAYDNLTSATAERPALERAEALQELERQSSAHYDPEMVQALKEALEADSDRDV